jgi:hypothetical protein
MNAAVEKLPPLKAGEARIIECSEEAYFADPCEVPSLSQSIANILLTESPLHAWTEHPRMGGEENEDGDEDTAALQAGKVIHKLLLGKGADVEIIHADNYRKKFAQEAKRLAVESGRVPMLARVYNEIVASVETIKSNLALLGINFDGESEVAIEWAEEGIHGPVVCRGRLDHLSLGSRRILDVKKIRSAHPETCGKHAIEYGYDIQNAAYTSAVEKLRPDLAGRLEMLFLFVEVDPPYAIYPGPLDGELRELGRQRWERAVTLWEHCLRTNKWPAYTDRISPIIAPGWAMTRWMEKAQQW